MDYNLFHAERAALFLDVKSAKVLVLGCNTGGDCRYFFEMGAAEIHGVDVVKGIGIDFQRPNVFYHQESAEQMSLPSNYFDLVYTFATMEHVPDIFRAFAEMERVLKPGGIIYSLAAPLWNSRNGHHFPQYFADYPWAHLRLDQKGALDYLVRNQIVVAPENISAEVVSNYMFDNSNFNMRHSREYLEATQLLSKMDALANTLDLEPEDALPADVWSELSAKGYEKDDLRAVTHCFIARKRQPKWAFWRK